MALRGSWQQRQRVVAMQVSPSQLAPPPLALLEVPPPLALLEAPPQQLAL